MEIIFTKKQTISFTAQGGPPREAGNHAIDQTINHAWKQKGSFINWILKTEFKSSLSCTS